VVGEAGQAWSQADEVRRLVPPFALAVAVVAAIADPAPALDVVLAAIPVAAFAWWAYLPNAPLPVVSIAVVVPVVVAQRSGALEPLFFEVSLLAFVVARWARTLVEAALLGLFAALSPVVVSLIQDPSKIGTGIWILGIVFPWLVARAVARERQLAVQLEATRRELAQQALLGERRRIARDIHDLVGHGLAAVMLQITSARHVLRRDPDEAEEALQSAEQVGRRSMNELRRTVTLLRSDDEAESDAPLPSVREIPSLVDDARAGGLAVELRMRGDVSALAPGVGLAVYRIAQEALANAARHAPHARTVLAVEQADGQVSLVADTAGPTLAARAGRSERPRYGLVGMRERAEALGGECAAGPTPDGWRVRCRLPLDADDAPTDAEPGTP
jgi:signal transduction histidine kinase